MSGGSSSELSTQKMDTLEECIAWAHRESRGGCVFVARLSFFGGKVFCDFTDNHPRSPLRRMIGPYDSVVEALRATRAKCDDLWGEGTIIHSLDPRETIVKTIVTTKEGERWGSHTWID